MAIHTGPVLAVVDCTTDDFDVIAEAAWLARAAHTQVLVVHVAQPAAATPWGSATDCGDRIAHEIGLEQRAVSYMRELADTQRPMGVEVVIDDVYFGDPASEVAYVASLRCASAVVAARRPGGWFAWHSRDARLARQLRVPLVLTDAPSPVGQRTADVQLLPNQPAVSAAATQHVQQTRHAA